MHQLCGFLVFLGAESEPAELIDALRGQSEVTADGYARLYHMPDSGQYLFAAFQFDGVCSALLEDTDRIAHGLLFAHLITAERHIDDDQCMLGGTYYALTQKDHLIYRDW